MRRQPLRRHHDPLDRDDGGEQQNSEHAQPDQRRPCERAVELRIGAQQKIFRDR